MRGNFIAGKKPKTNFRFSLGNVGLISSDPPFKNGACMIHNLNICLLDLTDQNV